jgi:hypothetical protein
MGMRKYLAGFGAGLVVLGIIAYICWSVFEVYDVDEWVPPIPEARFNSYLALDRWLTQTGHPVRLADSGDYETLAAAGEQTIFIQASLFAWSSGAVDFLFSWVERGGILVLSLDRGWILEEEEYLAEFLEGLGIGVINSSESRSYRCHSAEPDLDRSLVLEVPAENQDALGMKDSGGFIRLVRIRRGEGKAIVTGGVWFMNNYNLKKLPNARLAWNLLAESSGSPAGEPGVFFIRDFRNRRRGKADLFGRLFERGNFFAILFSGALLIVLGFWAAWSVFGVVREDDARPGKSLRERFLAEAGFLKRFGALDSYLAAYRSEIRRKLLKREGLKDENEIILLSASLLEEAGREDTIEAVRRAFSPSPVRVKDFRKTVILLKSILERL